MRKNILSIALIAIVVLAVGCSPRLRNNPFDFGSAYNSNVNAIYISAVSNIAVIDDTYVTLKWDRNIQPDFYAYKIYYSVGNSNNFSLAATINESSVLSYTVNGLLAFTDYWFKVVVENKAGYQNAPTPFMIRTQPTRGFMIRIKDPASAMGQSVIQGMSAYTDPAFSDTFLLYGYYGCPSQSGGLGAGSRQFMVRMYYLTGWGDSYEIDNLVLQYESTNTSLFAMTAANFVWYDLHDASLDNGVGSVFIAKNATTNTIYFSDSYLGFLYCTTSGADDTLNNNYWRRDAGDVTNYHKPSYIYNNGDYAFPVKTHYTAVDWGNSSDFRASCFRVLNKPTGDEIYAVSTGYYYADSGFVYKLNPIVPAVVANNTNFQAVDTGWVTTPMDYNDVPSFDIDDDNVYVLERSKCRFHIINRTTQAETIVGSPGNAYGQFNAPSDIVTFRNSVFVADTFNHRVQIFNTNGTFVSSIGTGLAGQADNQFDSPRSLTVTSNKVSSVWDVYLIVADKYSLKYFNIDSLFN